LSQICKWFLKLHLYPFYFDVLSSNLVLIRYLKDYWASRVKEIPKVKLHTSLNPQYSCAIGGVSVEGMTPAELDGTLFNKYKIHTVGIVWENISCARITPHIYTKIADLDKLAKAIGEIAAIK
jgi:selenocysteine lyase/cysteine desulfurase